MTERFTPPVKKRLAALLISFIVVLGALPMVMDLLLGRNERSRPAQFVGDWSVVDAQGGSRGIVTFLPDGTVDSHDDFAGKWLLRDGNIHVEFWKKGRDSLTDMVLPRREEYTFTPQFHRQDRPTALHGANVNMKRMP